MKTPKLFLNLPNVIVITIIGSCLFAFTNAKSTFVQVLSETFKIPFIKEEGKKADACLAPKYMMNAWYNIERVEPFCDTLKLASEKMKGEYYEFYEDYTNGKKEEFSNSALVVVVDTLNEVNMVKKPIWASYLFHRSFNDNRKVLQDDTLIQEVKSSPFILLTYLLLKQLIYAHKMVAP